MKPVLLLIDLQQDYLSSPALEPSAGHVVERARHLLQACRTLAVPVVHVWTTVPPDKDERMPHWKDASKWMCVDGTEGHLPPPPLRPQSGETVIHKTFFSGFSSGALQPLLQSLTVDTVWLAGVHAHSCVRATVLDAYAAGYRVCVAEDAVASDDPLHAASSRNHLQGRAAQFLEVERLLACVRKGSPPQQSGTRLPTCVVGGEPFYDAEEGIEQYSPRSVASPLYVVPRAASEHVARATADARSTWSDWSAATIDERGQVLLRLAERLESSAEINRLAVQMARDIGKPLAEGRLEVQGTARLLRQVAARATRPAQEHVRLRPLGVVALITPWNNPFFIPLGKLAPALLFGNTVVWKPAEFATALSVEVLNHLRAAGCPPSAVNLVSGDASTARALMAGDVDAVTITGSSVSGYAAQAACANRRLPLQAELGGNNAAVVWSDADLHDAARQIAAGAWAQAGQRCTANRRVIVEAQCYDEFVSLVKTAAAQLTWGDPLDEDTRIGPLVSLAQRHRVAAVVQRAREHCDEVPLSLTPPAMYDSGAYHGPVALLCTDPSREIVQEETFGPVLVLQRATDWDQAVHLCNGVRQGLVASVFTASRQRQEAFLRQAQAGIVKINRSTDGADPDLPFGGWKSTGLGPPEHGDCDRDFYTRVQTVYR